MEEESVQLRLGREVMPTPDGMPLALHLFCNSPAHSLRLSQPTLAGFKASSAFLCPALRRRDSIIRAHCFCACSRAASSITASDTSSPSRFLRWLYRSTAWQ